MPMSSSQYLLDTNICIYLLKKRFDVESRIRHVGIQNCFISEITLAELYYGASNSGHKEKKMEGGIISNGSLPYFLSVKLSKPMQIRKHI